jgi:hypothetical protein
MDERQLLIRTEFFFEGGWDGMGWEDGDGFRGAGVFRDYRLWYIANRDK